MRAPMPLAIEAVLDTCAHILTTTGLFVMWNGKEGGGKGGSGPCVGPAVWSGYCKPAAA